MATVYISSTYSDLKSYREAVYHALRQMRYDVIAMEDYVATDQRPLTKCLADVAACDLYIGIFAWRYGYIPPGENPQHKSITELEYREAIQTGTSCLIFLLAEDAPWSRAMMDEVTGEGNRGEYINALRRELAQEKLVKFFTSPEHLASLVAPSVHLWESNRITSDSSTSPTRVSVKHAQEAERVARLEAMFTDHSGFIRDRLSSFVGRVNELADIRQRITALQPTGGYVTITGQAGQGKSSIIAKLVEEYGPDKAAHHFIPFNPGPDHQVGLLRNVMARLILKYGLSDLYVASESRPALKEYFPKVLTAISEKGGKEEIFIDGLDQLQEDSNGERDLSFLPNDLPSGIVFVLGTRPDDALRPLKLLKPHDAYRLPNLSRQDFDLILQHRGVRLEKSLADQFYRSMQENALYLDLVAKELAEDETVAPSAAIECIADNPSNLFSLSMARLKRGHNQWREVIKPVLGILLVAREPLSLRHIRQIIGVDDDWLREGLERLGGLLAQDGQQRYYLFHLKLQEYLRQDMRMPDKEYVFASDEEESWHQRLARWCEQGNILTIWRDVKHDAIEQRRREYARQHYITHLYYAREWRRLFEVLDAEHYGKAKVAYEPGMRSYAQDLDLGRQAAAWEGRTTEEGIALLPRLWRYTLLRCSLTSRADTYSPEMFEILMLLKHEQEALGLAELLTRPKDKASIFVLIGKWLEQDHRRRQEGLQLLMRAQEIAEPLKERETIVGAIGKLSIELARASEWERAEVVAHILKRGKVKAEALRRLGKALVRAQQWERVEVVIDSIEEDWIKDEVLHELGVALVQAGEWERAEVVARSLEDTGDRAVVLRELGVALAQAGQWENSRSIAYSLEQIEDRTAVLQELGKTLTNARRWTQAAATWDEILSLAHSIGEKAARIKVLQELGRTLTQVRQWERVEVVWDEVVSLACTIKMSKKEAIVLRELGVALAQAREWQRAEAVARSIEYVEERTNVLRELVVGLVQAREWEHAEAIVRSIENVCERSVLLCELGVALAQAREWQRAEGIDE
jgi:tetratricopeptide (TPR) repeat protein